ncbi:MAG: 16S rRNA (uracil(1498)-N(3))-methyltransferase [Victivallales bacterium]|nr:16S rRNA (uracil(1498)-N(3))-methyltransferase [Victivallales bacterium]
MPSYYYPDSFEIGTCAVLSTEETTHALRVMRLEPGDHLTLLNGRGDRADAILLPNESSRRMRQANCRIESMENIPCPNPSIILYVAPPRNKNMDAVLKAATELGVSKIVPIICRYAVSKPESEPPATWTNVLITAMKQSGNPWLPILAPPTTFLDALSASHENGFFGAVPRPGETNTDVAMISEKSIALWVGPEGGFAPEEEQALRDKGLHPLTAGPWILRVETAVTALLGAIHIMLNA